MNATLLVEALDLVDEASDLAPDARERFYRDRCSQHPALLQVVLLMEAAPADDLAPNLHEDGDSFVQTLFSDPEQESDPLLGSTVGPYVIEELLGEGGMGRVYRATDTGLKTGVAFKVRQPKDPFHNRASERLQHEAEMHARCKHPGIVKILFSGKLPDGRTYFTMELIEGLPISAFCEEKQLSLGARLRLFANVCNAVKAAHDVGVIHRDLKPSNILVERDGSVRLLDFGVAEAFEDGDLGSRGYMSIAYASPEHLEQTSVQTDVYSLGVLLSQLLLGRLPFTSTGRTPSQQRQAILKEGLRPLRTLAQQDGKVPAWLKGLSAIRWRELDAICSKATQREAAARYASVSELTNDIEQFLARKPVIALTSRTAVDAWLYRSRRFVSRHQGAVLAASAAALLLFVCAGALVWGLNQSRKAAQQSALHAKRIQDLLQGMYMDGDGPMKATMTAQELLGKGVHLAEALQNEPEEQADTYKILGAAYQGLGQFTKAEDLLGRALRDREQIAGTDSAGAADILVQQADLLSAEGNSRRGLALLQRALAIQSRTLPANDMEILRSQVEEAELLTNLGDYDRAVPLLEAAIRRETGNPDLERDLSTAINDLSIVENYRGHYARCVVLQQQGMEIDRRLEGPRHPDIGEHLITLANTHNLLGQYATAENEARSAISILQDWLPANHPDLGSAHVQLGSALVHQYKLEEALPHLQLGLKNLEEEKAGSSTEAMALGALASLRRLQGQNAEALSNYQRSLAMYQTVQNKPGPMWVNELTGISMVLLAEGKAVQAEEPARQALQIARAVIPAGDGRSLQAEITLADSLIAQHRFDEARPLLSEALDLANKSTPPQAEIVAQAEKALNEMVTLQARESAKARPHGELLRF